MEHIAPTKPFAQIMLDIPDDILRQLMSLPKNEQGETLSDTINAMVRKGLRKEEFRELVEGERDQILGELFDTIRGDFKVGRTFNLRELLAKYNLDPTERKRIGRAFSDAVKNCQYVEFSEKTAQNLSTYIRVGA